MTVRMIDTDAKPTIEPTASQLAYVAVLGAAIAVQAAPDNPREARKWVTKLLGTARSVGFSMMSREEFHNAEAVLGQSGLLEHLRATAPDVLKAEMAAELAEVLADPHAGATFGPNGWDAA